MLGIIKVYQRNTRGALGVYQGYEPTPKCGKQAADPPPNLANSPWRYAARPYISQPCIARSDGGGFHTRSFCDNYIHPFANPLLFWRCVKLTPAAWGLLLKDFRSTPQTKLEDKGQQTLALNLSSLPIGLLTTVEIPSQV